jgi:uncharacterized protein YvpB
MTEIENKFEIITTTRDAGVIHNWILENVTMEQGQSLHGVAICDYGVNVITINVPLTDTQKAQISNYLNTI